MHLLDVLAHEPLESGAIHLVADLVAAPLRFHQFVDQSNHVFEAVAASHLELREWTGNVGRIDSKTIGTILDSPAVATPASKVSQGKRSDSGVRRMKTWDDVRAFSRIHSRNLLPATVISCVPELLTINSGSTPWSKRVNASANLLLTIE